MDFHSYIRLLKATPKKIANKPPKRDRIYHDLPNNQSKPCANANVNQPKTVG